MKIGIDARALSYNKAGVRTYLEEVLEYIGSSDCINDEFYLYTNKELKFPLSNKKCIIRKYNAKIGTIGLRYIVPRMLVEDGIDVFWGPAHVLPKKVKSVRYVLTIHDLVAFKIHGALSFYNEFINRAFCKKSVMEADKIIAISISTKNDLIHFFGISDNKIAVIYNGVSLYPYSYIQNRVNNSDFKATSAKFGIDNPYFFFVGTVEPRKNIVNTVKAFNLFKEKTNLPCKYVIAGGKGWRDAKIYDEIEKSAYKKDIVLAGYVSSAEKELLYRNALCLLFPSLYEGFGLPIIESLSVGTPVITSNVSAMPEVGGGVCNYVDPLNVNEIYDAMIGVMNDWQNKRVDEMRLVEQSKKFGRDNFAMLTYQTIINAIDKRV